MIYYFLFVFFIFSKNFSEAGECPVILDGKKPACAEQSEEIENLIKKHEKEKQEQKNPQNQDHPQKKRAP